MTLFSHAVPLSFWIIIRFPFLGGVKRLFSHFDKLENQFCVCGKSNDIESKTYRDYPHNATIENKYI